MISKILYILLLTTIFSLNKIQLSADILERKETYNIQNHTGHFQDFIHSAREYRKNMGLSPEKESLRQKNILKQFCSSLTKYDAHNSVEDAVCNFLTNELSLNEYEYTVINANLTNVAGKSHDSVFLIKDLNGVVCYVVKAFRNPRDSFSKFLPEISALDLIEQLSIPGVGAINPIAFALCSNQEEEWGLLLETAAKGQRIDHFVYQLANLSPDSKEREIFFDVCQKVFERMAESFAELHATKSSQPFFISMQDIEKYNKRISEVLENPFIKREIEKNFPLDVFSQYVEKIKTNALNVPIFYSYWHGDAHLGNVFYDYREDIFYFIDVAKMHYSVSITGEPLLDGTIDLMRIEENLRRIAIGLLSEVEVENLLKSFYNAYERYSIQGISQPIFSFHQTCKKLGRLLDYAWYVEEKDPIKRSTDQAIFESALEYFENQIKFEQSHARTY